MKPQHVSGHGATRGLFEKKNSISLALGLALSLWLVQPIAHAATVGSGDVTQTGLVVGDGTAPAESPDIDVNVRSDGPSSISPNTSSATALGISVGTRPAFTAGALNVTATSGTVSKSGSYVTSPLSLSSVASSTGITYSSSPASVLTLGPLTVTSQAGESDAVNLSGAANAAAKSTAIGTTLVGGGTVINTGGARVYSVGGTARSSGTTGAVSEAGAMSIGSQAYSGSLRNMGPLTVIAQGGEAIATSPGATASADASTMATGVTTSAAGDIANSGSLTVVAVSGVARASAGGSAASVATAQGIWGRGGNITNSGKIDVTATSTEGASSATATAYGILAGANSAVVNTAPIYSTANGGVRSGRMDRGFAYGIFFEGPGSLSSTAPVTVSSTGALGSFGYEVHAANGPVHVTDYNLALGTRTAATFHTVSSSSFVFDNAKLMLRPGKGFVEGQPFQVQSDNGTGSGTSEIGSGRGTLSGTIGTLVSADPDLAAVMGTRGTAQTVALGYAPPSSQPSLTTLAQQATAMYTGTLLHDHMTTNLILAPLYRAEEPQAGCPPWQQGGGEENDVTLFAQPYGSHLAYSGSPAGYDGNVFGIIAGVDKKMLGDKLLAGLHVGGDSTKVDFTGVYDGRDEEVSSVYGGAHAAWNVWDKLTVQASSTFFRADHKAHSTNDYLGDSWADSKSDAWFNTLGANYLVKAGERQYFVPELRITHIWQHRESYSTDSDQPDAVNTSFGSLDNNEVFGLAAVRWFTTIPLECTPGKDKPVVIRPSVSVGVQQTLTDGKISVEQSMPGTHVASPSVRGDMTLGVVSAGVALDTGMGSLELAYQGSMGENTQNHGGWVLLRIEF